MRVLDSKRTHGAESRMAALDRSRARILIADDQPEIREALRLLLKSEGLQSDAVASPGAALELAAREQFDAVLIDLNYTRDTTSGQEGIDLLKQLRQLDDRLPVVVMTAWGTIDLAVDAMRSGARDFVEKPWDNHRLLNVLRTQVALARAMRRTDRLEAENLILRSESERVFVATAPAMRPVLELIERVAGSDASVLITGENGTGKGLVARLLHERSVRAEQAFISVNMGGIAPSLFESELFGHVKGAFTDAKADRTGRFELADGGTLFLDEIGNLPTELQPKLLHILESGEFERLGASRSLKADVRLISATNADLDQLVASGGFRKDLLFRMNTVEIRLPPLRERLEDLPELAGNALQSMCAKYQRDDIRGYSQDALVALRAYSWPGNVRELEHVVERAVLMCRGDEIAPADLRLEPAPSPSIGGTSLVGMTIEEAERFLIRDALDRHGGRAEDAAKELGLSRSAIYRRLEKHGL
jgi:DNA-binding NtrC family response regulator